MKFEKTLLLFLFPFLTFAQNITLKGKVTDAESKEGLPSCNIFVNGTTIGANSDLEGNFQLNNLTIKEFDLVFSYVGYKSVSKKIVAKDGETITLDIELAPSDNLLTEVQVKSKRDKKWEKQLKKFKSYFLGDSDFADKCEIGNAWVLDFEEKEDGFYAKALEPLKIKNSALGYQISFELYSFYVGKDLHKVGGNVYFTEMVPSNKAKLEEWYANRAFAYKKSPAFLFKSLIDKKLDVNGFQLYAPKPGSNAIRTDNFEAELGKSVLAYDAKDMVGLGRSPEIKKIYIRDNLEVHNQSVKSDLKTYQGIDYGISWMQVKGNNVYVNENGMPYNYQDIVVAGDMDFLKVSGILPTDYNMNDSANEAYFLKFEKAPFAETVHLHTDRTMYFQGDKLWFKAYLNYSSFAKNDTASKVLYVQLIDESKKVVETQKIEVSNGFGYGAVVLPMDLPKGIYQIRAFTNYMRNFDNLIFRKSIPVLARNEKINTQDEQILDIEEYKIKANIEKFDSKTGEIHFSFKDLGDSPIGANFSLSVNNPQYSPDLNLNTDIRNDLNLKELKKPKSMPFLMEKGLEINGVFLDKKRIPVQSELNVFVNDLQNFSQTPSDVNGNFVFKGLTFYGQSDIYLQPVSKKMKENIFIIKNDVNYPIINVVPIDLKDKIVTQPEPVFKEIAAESTEVKEKAKDKRQKMLYGRPDYVVEENEINATNGVTGLINSILKKVPSLQMRGTNFVLRGGATSVYNSNAALILIDGVPMGSINSVNPNNVLRVEVVARMSNMYGDLGKNGIVSIFQKDKQSAYDDITDKNFTKVAVEGYKIAEVYSPESIKMVLPESLPTSYWNPEILTDEKGNATVIIGENPILPLKVTIEGLSQSNIPFRKVFFLK